MNISPRNGYEQNPSSHHHQYDVVMLHMKSHEQVMSHCYDNKPQKISKSVPRKKKKIPPQKKKFPPPPPAQN
jgi:hypothetical protein